MSRIVVIGGGFGGLACTRRLQKIAPSSAEVTLIDRRNHHLFQPLLYQVAMAGLSPSEIAVPIRSILATKGRRVAVMMGNVESVDLKNRRIKLESEELGYEFLVLACGTMHSYFGNES